MTSAEQDHSSFEHTTLGPLCLSQCFFCELVVFSSVFVNVFHRIAFSRMHGAALMVRNVNATSTLLSALVHRWSEHVHDIHHRQHHAHDADDDDDGDENDNDGRAVESGCCKCRPGKHSNTQTTHGNDDADDDDDGENDDNDDNDDNYDDDDYDDDDDNNEDSDDDDDDDTHCGCRGYKSAIGLNFWSR